MGEKKNTLRACPTRGSCRHLVRRQTTIWLCSLALFLPTVTSADDLMALYRAGVDNDPRYRAAEANYHAAEQRTPQARAGLLPRAQTSAARNRNDNETLSDRPSLFQATGQATYYSNEYSLSLTQPLYNGPALAGLRQAKAETRQAEAEYTAARQDLMLRVSEAYFQALLAQDAYTLATVEKETLSRNFEAVQAKQRVGVSGITELEDARARLQIAVAQEIQAANKLADRRQALREIIGRLPNELATATEIPLLNPDPPDIERWVDTALRQNLNILAATEAAEAAREEIGRNRAGHYPTLDLVGSRNRNEADSSIAGPGLRTDNRTIGVQFNLPLFQGGLVTARTEEAAHRYTAAQQELESRRRNAERSTRSAYQDIQGSGAQVAALKQAVASSEIALAAKTEGYRAGLYHIIDVLDAARDLFRTKRDYAEARYAYLYAFLRLKQAVGTLAEDDLHIISGWLKPAGSTLLPPAANTP